jgi:hypothetical protein
MDNLDEIFKKTAEQIKKPIKQDDLEYLLIENGLETDLKKGAIKKLLAAHGIVRKLIMIGGLREYYWANGNGESQMSTRIRFYKFLETFLEDKTEIAASELSQAVKDADFNIELLQKHFYWEGGNERKWRGWLLIKRDGERIYKNVDKTSENKPIDDDY